MRFIHYTLNLIEALDSRDYDQNELIYHAKPNGLWLSVESSDADTNWKEWCEREQFALQRLKYPYEATLKEDAHILYLKTCDEVLQFTKNYNLLKIHNGAPYPDKYTYTCQLDWNTIKLVYQGVVISPYQWECRMNYNCTWYYGWDCSSGCIWDLSCIEKFELQKGIENDG